jgi:hypothetical protein
LNPSDHLDVTLSAGRRVPSVIQDIDDSIRVIDHPSTPCPGCAETTVAGEPITKIHRTWWHAACAREWMAAAGEDEAWKALARQIAERPSRYKTTEIRVVMQRLLRMLGESEGL